MAINYFTKWLEAEPLTKITKKNIHDFTWKSIICHFKIPWVIITDNDKQFDKAGYREFCAGLGIKNHFSSLAHPQVNGQVEVTNRTLLGIIKKRLEGSKGLWPEELSSILWAHRTTVKTPTWETSFILAFGTEAVIPIDVGMTMYRIMNFNFRNNEGLKNNLDLLEEKMDEAALRMAAYKQRMVKYYNSWVKARRFVVRDLVLKKLSLRHKTRQRESWDRARKDLTG